MKNFVEYWAAEEVDISNINTVTLTGIRLSKRKIAEIKEILNDKLYSTFLEEAKKKGDQTTLQGRHKLKINTVKGKKKETSQNDSIWIEYDYPTGSTYHGQSYERIRQKVHKKDSANIKRKYPDI